MPGVDMGTNKKPQQETVTNIDTRTSIETDRLDLSNRPSRFLVCARLVILPFFILFVELILKGKLFRGTEQIKTGINKYAYALVLESKRYEFYFADKKDLIVRKKEQWKPDKKKEST